MIVREVHYRLFKESFAFWHEQAQVQYLCVHTKHDTTCRLWCERTLWIMKLMMAVFQFQGPGAEHAGSMSHCHGSLGNIIFNMFSNSFSFPALSQNICCEKGELTPRLPFLCIQCLPLLNASLQLSSMFYFTFYLYLFKKFNHNRNRLLWLDEWIDFCHILNFWTPIIFCWHAPTSPQINNGSY